MRRDLAFIALLIAAILVFFWKIALTELILAGPDSFTYFYPLWDYTAARLRQLEIPLWNPYLFLGAPFLANLQAAVLYPLNWIWLWSSAPKAVAYALLSHILLAGLGTYVFARRALGLGPLASWVAGALLSLSGYLGAQAEHVNQVSVLAWLPLILWLWHTAHQRRGPVDTLAVGIALGLQFLAGHAQASFMNLVALVGYASYLSWDSGRRSLRFVLTQSAHLAAAILLGLGLAAVQLLPTLELAQRSLRGEGLSYRQAVSFSWPPGSILLSLLPSLEKSPFSEYIAYPGVVATLLAGVALITRPRQARFFAVLAGLGLFLALGLYNPLYLILYSIIPGFNLFRVPARWLFLFALGMAMLAGIGMDAWVRGEGPRWTAMARAAVRSAPGRWIGTGTVLLAALVLLLAEKPAPSAVALWMVVAIVALVLMGERGRWRQAALAALMLSELFVASRHLVYDRATAPEAYSSLRPPTLDLLARGGIDRVLSISDTRFDPGDLSDMQSLYADRLSERALLDLIVATKWVEVLAPNLSLAYGLPSVDGYDGGLLPTARYVEFQQLLLPAGEPSLDGRLYQRLKELPPQPFLDLLNVRYVLLDKLRDVWMDDVYYDLGLTTVLDVDHPQATVAEVPAFPATAIAVLSYFEGEASLSNATPAYLDIATEQGTWSYPVQLGVHTAGQGSGDGLPSIGDPSHPGALLYRGLWRLDHPGIVREIRLRYVGYQGRLVVRGLALWDQRTGTHRSLIISNRGRYRLVHSGDIKIYENLDALPRATLVHRVRVVQSDGEALRLMQDRDFQPAQEVLLSGTGRALDAGASTSDRVELLVYEPERQILQVTTDRPGYLRVSDAYYPGWRATLGGQPVEIHRADFLFRAVYVPAGQHRIEFIYEAASFRLGVLLSTAALLASAAALLWTRSRRARRAAL